MQHAAQPLRGTHLSHRPSSFWNCSFTDPTSAPMKPPCCCGCAATAAAAATVGCLPASAPAAATGRGAGRRVLAASGCLRRPSAGRGASPASLLLLAQSAGQECKRALERGRRRHERRQRQPPLCAPRASICTIPWVLWRSVPGRGAGLATAQVRHPALGAVRPPSRVLRPQIDSGVGHERCKPGAPLPAALMHVRSPCSRRPAPCGALAEPLLAMLQPGSRRGARQGRHRALLSLLPAPGVGVRCGPQKRVQ